MQRNVNDLGLDLRERHHFCDQLKIRDYSADPGGKLVAINDAGKFAPRCRPPGRDLQKILILGEKYAFQFMGAFEECFVGRANSSVGLTRQHVDAP